MRRPRQKQKLYVADACYSGSLLASRSALTQSIQMLYDRLNVPCVPVALNSGLFWPRNSILRHPGTIVVEILPVIPSGLPRGDFAQRLEQTIQTATERLVEAERTRRAEQQHQSLPQVTPREP